ncbi:hypothetical protein MIND_00368600 [Mycena indigotica]|uniref:Uncharacterized protein n=1 Tax=Mycena indigotica TaxID=2126181 RepID=A0A8H6T325_9AGAR|nr:uncharacterized protein MIND_00368600 [Mycena indigotica]KAF7309960.1 hypothetical protein MIND_00368600 [Mycena indigotica]
MSFAQRYDNLHSSPVSSSASLAALDFPIDTAVALQVKRGLPTKQRLKAKVARRAHDTGPALHSARPPPLLSPRRPSLTKQPRKVIVPQNHRFQSRAPSTATLSRQSITSTQQYLDPFLSISGRIRPDEDPTLVLPCSSPCTPALRSTSVSFEANDIISLVQEPSALSLLATVAFDASFLPKPPAKHQPPSDLAVLACVAAAQPLPLAQPSNRRRPWEL